MPQRDATQRSASSVNTLSLFKVLKPLKHDPSWRVVCVRGFTASRGTEVIEHIENKPSVHIERGAFRCVSMRHPVNG